MKALLVLAAVAGTAFVGYSYTSTDGQTCAVCPLTGEPIMTSTESDGACCSGTDEMQLTGLEGEAASCCSKGESTCTLCEGCASQNSEAMLTSVDGAQCEACASKEGCTKGCCSEKEEMVAEEGESQEAKTVIAVEDTE